MWVCGSGVLLLVSICEKGGTSDLRIGEEGGLEQCCW